MNQHTIGENAGIIWRLLNGYGYRSYAELKEESGLSDRDLNMAIGWLAREGKVEFALNEEEGRDDLYVELNLYIG